MIELHRQADVLVERTGQLLVKRLLLLETRYEDFKEFLERGHGQVLPAIVIDCHLLHLAVLLHKLPLLRLERGFASAFATFGLALVIGI